MGFQDRHYQHQHPFGPHPGYRTIYRMHSLSPVVKYLIIINVAVHLFQTFSGGALTPTFAAYGHRPEAFQLWRLISFQFLHANMFHILFNMMGLYFLGPNLERTWGSKRFLRFYLICGAVGGALYVIADSFQLFGQYSLPLVGASGGVLGMLVACAILFPHFMVIFFIFPVPIRTAVMILTVIYVISVLGRVENAGGNLCHLGGMATGLIWVLGRSGLVRALNKSQQGAFQKKQQQTQQLQFEVDRILAKVHQQGIHSLTPREKDLLQKATQKQQRRD